MPLNMKFMNWNINMQFKTYVPGGVSRFRILGSAAQVEMNSSLETLPSPSLSISLKMALARSTGSKCALWALVWFIIWNIDLTNFIISDSSMNPLPSTSYILKIDKKVTFIIGQSNSMLFVVSPLRYRQVGFFKQIIFTLTVCWKESPKIHC